MREWPLRHRLLMFAGVVFLFATILEGILDGWRVGVYVLFSELLLVGTIALVWAWRTDDK